MTQETDTPKQTRVLVIADTRGSGEHLAGELLPQAGYAAATADTLSSLEECDIILVDVSQLRAAPLAGLETQRNLGNEAPALLVAPRLTSEMASSVFELDIRDFLRKPVEDEVLLRRINSVVSSARADLDREELERRLESTRAMMRRRVEEMNALSRIGRAITATDDVETILTRVVEAAMYLTRADEVVLYLLDQAGAELELRAHKGANEEQISALWHPSGDSMMAAVMETGEPVMSSDVQAGTKFTTGYFVPSAVSVPITTAHAVIGVLAALRRTEREFEPADLAALINLGDYAGMAVGRLREVGELEERVEKALMAARLVEAHAETLLSPVEGIASNVEALLEGEFGPLTEDQHGVVARVRLAVIRLDEIVSLIQASLSKFKEKEPPAE